MIKSPLAMAMIALAPVALAAIWCLVSLAVSKLGGWYLLAKQFPAFDAPTGRCFRVQRGKVGLAAYNGCLTIHSAAEGFYLSVWPLFRIGHQTLFIPWDAVQNRITRRLLWTETVVFDVGNPSIAALELPKSIFREFDLRAWRPGGHVLVCAGA